MPAAYSAPLHNRETWRHTHNTKTACNHAPAHAAWPASPTRTGAPWSPLYSTPPSARCHNLMDVMCLRVRGASCSPCVSRRLSCTSRPGCDPCLYVCGAPQQASLPDEREVHTVDLPHTPCPGRSDPPTCSALGSICHQLRGPLCLWHLQLVQTRHHLRLDNPVPRLQLLDHFVAVRDIPKHSKGSFIKG